LNLKSVKVYIKIKDGCKDLPLPKYATSGSSGMDLCADVDGEVTILPGEIKLISSGVYLSIPHGFEAEVRPRSGLALKHGISLVNTPGTIDSDYRGEIRVILINLGNEPFPVRRGDRIAQLVFAPVLRASLRVVDDLDATRRGEGGFGHTGV